MSECISDNRSLSTVIEESLQLLSKYVIPIYRTYRRRPQLAGSGFFVTNAGKDFLVSAAHVLDEMVSNPLFFYIAPGVTRNLSGDLIRPRVMGSRNSDLIDVAVLMITGQDMPPYPDVDKHKLQISSLVPQNIPRAGKHYAIVGFPSSKSKPNPDAKTVKAIAYAYHNPSIDDMDYDRFGFDPKNHVLMSFDQKNGFDKNGRHVAFPNPQGMSGSPLWELFDNDVQNANKEFSVAGVGIEHRKDSRLMISTDIKYVLEMIRSVS